MLLAAATRSTTAADAAAGMFVLLVLSGLLWVLIWVVLGTWCGARRGHPMIGALCAFLAGPIGVVIACLLPDDSGQANLQSASSAGARRGLARQQPSAPWLEELSAKKDDPNDPLGFLR